MASSLVEFSNSLADAVAAVGNSIIALPDGGREGVSGTIWRDGLAVAAEHTIHDQDEVSVILPSGEQTKAKLAGRDPGTDIAVLKLASASKPATLADDSHARVGEIVLSVGRRGTDGLAATYGVVSAIGGPWRTWQGARIDRFLRLDLNPFTGFSGGPIVNASGEVLGIATSGPRHSVLTVPSSTVTRVVDSILKGGRVARGYIGVGIQAVAFPENTRQAVGIDADRGLLVVTVATDSSAEKAGLLVGDIIVRVDGATVRGARSLQAVLDTENIGKPVSFEVIRAGKLHKVTLAVGERSHG